VERKTFKVDVQKADKMLRASVKGNVFLTGEGKALLYNYSKEVKKNAVKKSISRA